MAGKSVLVIDTPKTCKECRCQMMLVCVPADEDIDEYVDPSTAIPEWCPLSHPLKRVSNDFYIYDRKYLFDHLDREIDLLKGTKAFEEFMKAREEE